MDFDLVLTEIGSFGRYQAFLVLAALWSMVPIGCNISGVVFLAYKEASRCALPSFDSDVTIFDEELMLRMIPRDSITKVYSTCSQYSYNTSGCNATSSYLCTAANSSSNGTLPDVVACMDGYRHEKKTFTETISTEWDLVCEKEGLTSLSTSVFCFGMLIGSLIGGTLADRYGRITTMVGGTILNVAVAVGGSYSPNFFVFVLLRFTIGALSVAVQIAMSVYTIEIVGKSWRPWIGLQLGVFSGIGYMFLSVLAYSFRHWRMLQLMLGITFVPFLLFAPFMLESPRYLFAKGRIEKAKQVCRLMAKRNGRTLDENIWRKADISTYQNVEKKSSYSPMQLCRSKHVSLLLAMMIELWFINSLIFFFLAFNAGNWSGNPFLNNCLSGLVECIACLFIVPVINRFGRRNTVMFCLTFAGCFILLSEALKGAFDPSKELDILGVVLLLTAKFAVSASFNMLFLYTSELFPTNVRNTALGISSTGGRLASIISPFLLQLQTTLNWIIPVCLGLMSIASAAMAYWVPETRGATMLTTVREAKHFYASQREDKKNLTINNNRLDFVLPESSTKPMLPTDDDNSKV